MTLKTKALFFMVLLICLMLTISSCQNLRERSGRTENIKELGVKTSSHSFVITKAGEFQVADPKIPLKWLSRLECFDDGSFVAADVKAGVLRRFRGDGEFLGYLTPKEFPENRWAPEWTATDPDGRLLVCDHAGRIWGFGQRFSPLGMINQLPGPLSGLPIYAGLDGRIYFAGLYRDRIFTLHLLGSNAVKKSFLESDDNDRFLDNACSQPWVAVHPDGTLYAIRMLENTLFKFSSDGRGILSWKVNAGKHYRAFERLVNIFAQTRDRSLVKEWERTFSMFAGLRLLQNGKFILVFVRNAPPDLKNTVSLYTSDGEFLGTQDVEGYLVGSDRTNCLYFSNQDRFFEGECLISKYCFEVRLP